MESQASSVAPMKQRAKKTSYALDAEVEKALMEWIKENQILWNSKLILFKRTDMKEALWTEKGQQLQKTAKYLRGWWRSIKDNFTRLDKKKSGDEPKELTEREEWILNTCSFSRPLVRHKSQPLRSVSINKYHCQFVLMTFIAFMCNYLPFLLFSCCQCIVIIADQSRPYRAGE